MREQECGDEVNNVQSIEEIEHHMSITALMSHLQNVYQISRTLWIMIIFPLSGDFDTGTPKSFSSGSGHFLLPSSFGKLSYLPTGFLEILKPFFGDKIGLKFVECGTVILKVNSVACFYFGSLLNVLYTSFGFCLRYFEWFINITFWDL